MAIPQFELAHVIAHFNRVVPLVHRETAAVQIIEEMRTVAHKCDAIVAMLEQIRIGSLGVLQLVSQLQSIDDSWRDFSLVVDWARRMQGYFMSAFERFQVRLSSVRYLRYGLIISDSLGHR